MTSPTVSIILSVFNDKERITRCLDSLHRQTVQDFEVIAINDQSTDGTDRILQHYCAQHARFFYFEGQRKGAYQCRNQALDLCKGKYVVFMDSDDWIEENMLASLLNCCSTFKTSAAMCSVKRFHEKTGEYTNHFQTKKFPSTFLMNASYIYRISGGTTHKIYLRSNIENLGLRFLEYKTSADLEFNWRYFLSYPKVSVSRDTHYVYTVRDNSLVTGRHGVEGLDIIKVFAEIKKLLISTHHYKAYKYAFLTVATARLNERFQKESKHKLLFIATIIHFLGVSFFINVFLFSIRKKLRPLKMMLLSS